LTVWKLDRLGRSIKDLIQLVNKIQNKGAESKSLNDHIDTTTPHGKLTFHMFAALAEFGFIIIYAIEVLMLESTGIKLAS